jgi:hypothetical protein
MCSVSVQDLAMLHVAKECEGGLHHDIPGVTGRVRGTSVVQPSVLDIKVHCLIAGCVWLGRDGRSDIYQPRGHLLPVTPASHDDQGIGYWMHVQASWYPDQRRWPGWGSATDTYHPLRP